MTSKTSGKTPKATPKATEEATEATPEVSAAETLANTFSGITTDQLGLLSVKGTNKTGGKWIALAEELMGRPENERHEIIGQSFTDPGKAPEGFAKPTSTGSAVANAFSGVDRPNILETMRIVKDGIEVVAVRLHADHEAITAAWPEVRAQRQQAAEARAEAKAAAEAEATTEEVEA